MIWWPFLLCSASLLMCVAITPAAGQAKQFTLKPSGPRTEATDAGETDDISSSVMSSVPAPSRKDEGIEYTLVEVEQIPVTPTPPLSKDDLKGGKGDLSSSIPFYEDTTTGPRTSEESTDDSLRPTSANVLSSPHFYTPAVANDSISLEPSTVVSTAPPTSEVVTPPLLVNPSLSLDTLTTHETVTSSAALEESTCGSCNKLTSSSKLSDQRQPLSSQTSTPNPSSGLAMSTAVSHSNISPVSSSLLASADVVSCMSGPCSNSVTEMDDISPSPSTVFMPGNSSHFITSDEKDYHDSSTSLAFTTEAGSSPSTDDNSSPFSDKLTSLSPGSDTDITTESNNDITPNDSITEAQPWNSSSHMTHMEQPLLDFAVKFTASSVLRCANRPSTEKAIDFVLHSLFKSFDLNGSHATVRHPSCHCMTVNFLSVKREEVKKVEALVRSRKLVFVMNFTLNGESHFLQLTGSSTVRFDAQNLRGGADECSQPVPRKVPWRRLSKAEQIIVITVCTAGAMVVLAAFLFCLYEVQRRHTRKSFRLQSGSANMVRTEDYSLTKLDRPNTMYTDRGLIMEPIQPDDVPLPTMYSSSTSLEKPPGAHLANSPQKEWPLAPDPFPIRPSTSTENLVTAAARSRAGRRGEKIPGFDNPSFSSDDILASDGEENENDETVNRNSHDTCPEINGIKKEAPVKSNLLRPVCDSNRSESIT